MSTVWSYFGIENMALTAPQKATFVAALQALGSAVDPSPARRNHWRVRLDNDAILFEAAWDDTTLTIAAFKAQLASAFGVAVGTISHAVTTPTFATLPSTLITFTYLSVARLRVVLFGGVAATHAESRNEAAAYLAANVALWETP